MRSIASTIHPATASPHTHTTCTTCIQGSDVGLVTTDDELVMAVIEAGYQYHLPTWSGNEGLGGGGGAAEGYVVGDTATAQPVV